MATLSITFCHLSIRAAVAGRTLADILVSPGSVSNPSGYANGRLFEKSAVEAKRLRQSTLEVLPANLPALPDSFIDLAPSTLSKVGSSIRSIN